MADEVQTLGLDASGVISTLNNLDAAYNQFSQVLRANISVLNQYNTVQANTEDLLGKTASKMDELKDAAKEANEFVRSSLSGGIRSKATLEEISRVNDAFANLQKVLVSTKVGNSDTLLDVMSNLKGEFTGDAAAVQSAVIRVQEAL